MSHFKKVKRRKILKNGDSIPFSSIAAHRGLEVNPKENAKILSYDAIVMRYDTILFASHETQEYFSEDFLCQYGKLPVFYHVILFQNFIIEYDNTVIPIEFKFYAYFRSWTSPLWLSEP